MGKNVKRLQEGPSGSLFPAEAAFSSDIYSTWHYQPPTFPEQAGSVRSVVFAFELGWRLGTTLHPPRTKARASAGIPPNPRRRRRPEEAAEAFGVSSCALLFSWKGLTWLWIVIVVAEILSSRVGSLWTVSLLIRLSWPFWASPLSSTVKASRCRAVQGADCEGRSRLWSVSQCDGGEAAAPAIWPESPCADEQLKPEWIRTLLLVQILCKSPQPRPDQLPGMRQTLDEYFKGFTRRTWQFLCCPTPWRVCRSVGVK